MSGRLHPRSPSDSPSDSGDKAGFTEAPAKGRLREGDLPEVPQLGPGKVVLGWGPITLHGMAV